MMMAAENYIRDLSQYLMTGNLSDLTLTFGEKSWRIHKALACCHSKWFQKAVNSGFKEADSEVINLNDDPAMANAIDCMVSYFYKAGYTANDYNISAPLLHAQVATIADKYDCASLYKLASNALGDSMRSIEGNDWVEVAALIYEHTTADLQAHQDLRNLILTAIEKPAELLQSVLQMENTSELFRSNADLATDCLLLLGGALRPREDDLKDGFVCGHCYYVHTGSRNCSFLASVDHSWGLTCPKCRSRTSTSKKSNTRKVDVLQIFPCPSCDGTHTIRSEPEPESQLMLGFNSHA